MRRNSNDPKEIFVEITFSFFFSILSKCLNVWLVQRSQLEIIRFFFFFWKRNFFVGKKVIHLEEQEKMKYIKKLHEEKNWMFLLFHPLLSYTVYIIHIKCTTIFYVNSQWSLSIFPPLNVFFLPLFLIHTHRFALSLPRWFYY